MPRDAGAVGNFFRNWLASWFISWGVDAAPRPHRRTCHKIALARVNASRRWQCLILSVLEADSDEQTGKIRWDAVHHQRAAPSERNQSTLRRAHAADGR